MKGLELQHEPIAAPGVHPIVFSVLLSAFLLRGMARWQQCDSKEWALPADPFSPGLSQVKSVSLIKSASSVSLHLQEETSAGMSFEKGKNLPCVVLLLCKVILAAAFKPLFPWQSVFHMSIRTWFRKMLVTNIIEWLGYPGRGRSWAACDESLLCLLPRFPGVLAIGISDQQDSSA